VSSNGGALWLKYGLTLLAIGLAIATLISKYPAYVAVFAFVMLAT
jgi:hypothetical protein